MKKKDLKLDTLQSIKDERRNVKKLTQEKYDKIELEYVKKIDELTIQAEREQEDLTEKHEGLFFKVDQQFDKEADRTFQDEQKLIETITRAEDKILLQIEKEIKSLFKGIHLPKEQIVIEPGTLMVGSLFQIHKGSFVAGEVLPLDVETVQELLNIYNKYLTV